MILPAMRVIGARRRSGVLERGSLAGHASGLSVGDEVPQLPGWRCVPSPGHTPGHVSFLRPADRILITGDALVTIELNRLTRLLRPGLSEPPWCSTWDRRRFRESIRTLAGHEAAVVLPGHGAPLVGADTATRVRTFADSMHDRRPGRHEGSDDHGLDPPRVATSAVSNRPSPQGTLRGSDMVAGGPVLLDALEVLGPLSALGRWPQRVGAGGYAPLGVGSPPLVRSAQHGRAPRGTAGEEAGDILTIFLGVTTQLAVFDSPCALVIENWGAYVVEPVDDSTCDCSPGRAPDER